MKTNFLENNHVVHCVPTLSIASASDMWVGNGAATIVNSDVLSLANADGAVFMVIKNVGTGSASVRICACNNTTPTTTVAVSFRYLDISAPDTVLASGEATSYLLSTGTDIVTIFEVDAAKVAEQGYEYVYFNADEVGNTDDCEGAIIAFLTGLRYKEDDIGTQAP